MHFAGGEYILAYAAAYIEVFIGRDNFLIFFPYAAATCKRIGSYVIYVVSHSDFIVVNRGFCEEMVLFKM